MSNAVIEVRIRQEDEARGVHLCTWPATDLESLTSAMNRWGLQVDGNDDASGLVFGSFVYRDGEAFFELVVSNEGEG